MENLFNTFSYDVWHTEQDDKLKKHRKREKTREKQFKELLEETKKSKEDKKNKKKKKKDKSKKKKRKKEKDAQRSESSEAGARLSEPQMQQLLAALSLQQQQASKDGSDTSALKLQIQQLRSHQAASSGIVASGPVRRPPAQELQGSSDESNDEYKHQLVELYPEHMKRRGHLPNFKKNVLPASIQDQLGRPVTKPNLVKIKRSISQGPRDPSWKYNRTPSPISDDASSSSYTSDSESDSSASSGGQP